LYLKLLQNIFIPLFLVCIVSVTTAQKIDFISDSTLISVDTLAIDSSTIEYEEPISSNVIETPIYYNAEDSMIFVIDSQKIFLYGDAVVKYKEIELKASHIEFDMNNNIVFAKGTLDSLGKETGNPEFKEGNEVFLAKTLRYNFETKKGIIYGVRYEQQGEGILHSEKTKKHANAEIHFINGKYTTCNADHPHFYIALTKGKDIPDDKIVSGPAYLVVEDIPLPIVIPFALFPNTNKRASGIIIPSLGDELKRGFNLRNGGYYFGINDYIGLRLTGEIFTKGTWGISSNLIYRKRYKFRSNFNLRYYTNITSEKELPDYSKTKDFSVLWSHTQDPKANPTQSFNASVNFSSRTFDKNHSLSSELYLTNQKSSSITYSKRWPGSPFNLTASLKHSQNTRNRMVNLNFPKVAFTMSRIYPLRRKTRPGKMQWYENIQLSYSSRLENNIQVVDSLLFKPPVLSKFENGYQHEIPVSLNFKPLPFINFSPNIRYSGRLYPNSIRKYYDKENNEVITDTISGIKYAHSYIPSVSLLLTQKIYGIFQFRSSRIEVIRHVITPSVSFSFTPDMTEKLPDYFRTLEYIDVNDDTIKTTYSIFENGIYKLPSARGRSGVINFSLNNNFEMKVSSSNDTITKSKKIVILERLAFSTMYNIYRDSLNLNPIGIRGATRFLNNNITLQFGGIVDPYQIDSLGKKFNSFEWKNSGKIGRLTSLNFSLNMRLKSKIPVKDAGKQERGGIIDGTSNEDTELYTGGYTDFSAPWNVNIRYNLRYSKPAFKETITQTLNFSGGLSLTPKWKIGFSSGFDFKTKELTHTNLNIHRDLHCWEMRLVWIPFGIRQSYFFTINIKSSMLRDTLKLEKRRSWYDKPEEFGMF